MDESKKDETAIEAPDTTAAVEAVVKKDEAVISEPVTVATADEQATDETIPTATEQPVAETDIIVAAVPSGSTPAPNVAVPKIEDEYKPSDIFLWANNLYQYKDQLKIELFLINKNNVMYRTKITDDLIKQMQPLFINGILDYVLKGAGEGLVVRGFEEAEAEENVLQRVPWKNVEKLMEVMHWIRTQEEEMELFIEEEHDIKRMKAVLARGTHPSLPPFYVIKALPTAQILKGQGAWMVMNKVMMPMDAATLRIPAGNELLVLEQDLYVFNQQKLDRLFGYNAKKNSIAEKKVQEILDQFQLVFAEGNDMQKLVKGNKPLINKLQKLELTPDMKQDRLMEHSDELGIDLMSDPSGAIIIEDTKDLMKFVNLLNDDYVESLLTGQRYEIKSKKILKLEDNEEAGL
jgi:hypothetical protein